MFRFTLNRQNNAFVLATCILLVSVVFFISSIGQLQLVAADQSNNYGSSTGSGLSSYLDSARQLLTNGMEAHQTTKTYSSLMPNDDPRTTKMLRDTIDRTTDLINDYQHDGLANMPALPNLPGLNTIMRLPDKLLRAELSMLQDGIRMAQELRERPITATVNAPRDLANMFLRMTDQLNQ